MKNFILTLCLCGALVHGLRAFVSTSKVTATLATHRATVVALASE